MHVTSDYYRSGEHLPEQQDSLLARWSRSVQNASKSLEREPLSPSCRTLRKLASHYQECHAFKHSA